MSFCLAFDETEEAKVGLQDIFLRPVEANGDYRERLISMDNFATLEAKIKDVPQVEKEGILLAYEQVGWLLPQLSKESQREVILDFHEYWSRPIHRLI